MLFQKISDQLKNWTLCYYILKNRAHRFHFFFYVILVWSIPLWTMTTNMENSTIIERHVYHPLKKPQKKKQRKIEQSSYILWCKNEFYSRTSGFHFFVAYVVIIHNVPHVMLSTWKHVYAKNTIINKEVKKVVRTSVLEIIIHQVLHTTDNQTGSTEHKMDLHRVLDGN